MPLFALLAHLFAAPALPVPPPVTTLAQARERASAWLTGDGREWVIDDALSEEHPFGWVFFYVPRPYVTSHDVRDLIPGNGPLVVTREGLVEPLTTSVDSKRAIEGYAQKWKSAHPGEQ